MDLQLGFKVTRVADEFTSTEFQFAKDRAGPLFQSAETNTRFILIAHLKGYTRGNIKIDINETVLVITGEKPVQETVMVGWKVIKKDVEITKFTKTFKIPDGVILDKVKTKFNEEDSVLTITMPKRVKGILGTLIEEVKDQPELHIRADKIPKRVTFQEDKGAESSVDSLSTYVEGQQENEKEMPQKPSEEKSIADEVSHETELRFQSSSSNVQNAREEVEKPTVKDEFPRTELKSLKVDDMVEEKRETHSDQIGEYKTESTSLNDQLKDDKVCEIAKGIHQEEIGDLTRTGKEEKKLPERGYKISVPIVAGSAVILSLAVFVMHFMRTKNQTDKRKG